MQADSAAPSASKCKSDHLLRLRHGVAFFNLKAQLFVKWELPSFFKSYAGKARNSWKSQQNKRQRSFSQIPCHALDCSATLIRICRHKQNPSSLEERINNTTSQLLEIFMRERHELLHLGPGVLAHFYSVFLSLDRFITWHLWKLSLISIKCLFKFWAQCV